MTKRPNQMNWLWCMLVLLSGPAWTPARGIALPGHRNRPSLIESQAKFFQDFFSVQLSPYKIEFGHVCEDPNTWEQRYEKKDYKNHRDMGKLIKHCLNLSLRLARYRQMPTSEDFDQGHRLGSEDHFTERHERSRPASGLFNAKVRWGDKKGGYGEHYWDLNHAGHTADHDNDDYDSNSHDNSYDEPSDQSPTYEANEKTHHEESERTKRGNAAKPREDLQRGGQYDGNYTHNEQQDVVTEKKRRSETKPREKNHIVLVVNHRDRGPNRGNVRQFVPYVNGAGVRRHQSLESSASESVPRLFFESSTGRVIDRTTGQAYVLQPVNVNH